MNTAVQPSPIYPIYPKPSYRKNTLHNNTTRLLQLAQNLRQQRIDNLLDLVLLALALLLMMLLLLLVVWLLLVTGI